MRRNKKTAAYLALFLGIFGIHKFYLGLVKECIAYFLLSITLFHMIVGWMDAINYFQQKQERFDQMYNQFDK